MKLCVFRKIYVFNSSISHEIINIAMKVLFIGHTWNGSSARSLRDALVHVEGVELDDIGEDHFQPKGRSLLIRGINRLLKPLYQRELAAEILRRCRALKPDAVIVYKGSLVPSRTISAVQFLGIKVVNVFPDASPHAHGSSMRKAIGQYDLIISTKPFHPEHWNTTYGYTNHCVCVPHGYDPEVHYWANSGKQQDIDLVIAASWRPQYEALIAEVGRLLPDTEVSVALAGPGWAERRSSFPGHWEFPGPIYGRAYGEFIRRGKIVIAPVHTDVVINSKQQPGDQDTTRTYELAAAGTFFLHRRTPFAQQVYEEGIECGFWDDATELAEKVRHYLPRERERRAMAAAAQRRAVPAYSVPARAEEVLAYIKALLKGGTSQ